MNFDAFKLFCDVVRCNSFSRGAAMNGISQSAASQAIHHVERQIGARLMDRTKRPFVLTAEGEIYYQGLCDILERYDAIEAAIHTLRQEMAGLVRVAAIYSVGLHNMAECMQRFMSRYPKARARLEYLPPAKVHEAVLNQEVDLGIVSYPSATRELNVILLRSEKMVLACHPDHHLAHKTSVSVRQLHGENFVGFDSDLAIRRELDAYFRRNQVVVRVVMEFDNIETIKQAIEIGAGVSILPEPTLRNEVRNHTLVAVPLDSNDLQRPLGIIHRRRKPFTPILTKFVEALTSIPQDAERPAGD